MFSRPNSYAWLYRNSEWLKIKNPLSDMDYPRISTTSRRPVWRRILQDYARLWLRLGPTTPPSDYSGLLVSVYSYTGAKKAPQYLVRVVSVNLEEIIYAHDLPDILEVLTLLAPLVSDGIFTDAYSLGVRRQGG